MKNPMVRLALAAVVFAVSGTGFALTLTVDTDRSLTTEEQALLNGAEKSNPFVKKGTEEVRGELLVVDDEGFKSMDRLEGYPRLYRREEIDVWTQYGKGRAWVYIMNRLPENAKLIEGGDWREHRRS